MPNGTQWKMPGTSCTQHWPAGQLSDSVEHEMSPSDDELSASVELLEPVLVDVLAVVPTVLESVLLVLIVPAVVLVDVLPPSPDSSAVVLELPGPHALAIPMTSNHSHPIVRIDDAWSTRVDHIAIDTYLISTNASIAHLPPSRPQPDAFMPPKGACAVEIAPSLRPTMPVSSASATRSARTRSRV